MTNAHIGTCRMCSKVGLLEAGHVIPSFVYRWLKDTSVTGYIRTETNGRVQDGRKRWWFCRHCEDQIGRFEKAFAEKLFSLIVGDKPAPFTHGSWLSRFIASVAWRAVMLDAESSDAFDLYTPEQQVLLPLAMERWRAFILGEAETPGVHELHFIPMGGPGHYQGDRTLPPNINRYILRNINIHVARDEKDAFAFVKMGPAVALGFIQPSTVGQWRGTRVALGDGQVGGTMTAPGWFLDYIIDRAQKALDAERSRSARQTGKINRAFWANPGRVAASGTFRATVADVRRFGVEKVFPPDALEQSQRTESNG